MADHGSTENGINYTDRYINYMELYTVLNEVVVCFAHLHAYGVSKCMFLAGLTGLLIHNLEDINCPPSDSFSHDHCSTLSYQKFPKFACATKTAHSLYDLLMYYVQKKVFVQCPPDMTRHTADFVADV